jgi:hypothetical protein
MQLVIFIASGLSQNAKKTQMRSTIKIISYLSSLTAVVIVHALFFLHHPPEIQFVFLSPGVTLLAYSVIRDDFYVKPNHRLLKKNNIFQ